MKILFCINFCIIFYLPGKLYAQNGSPHVIPKEIIADTNVILKIVYPPITEREGKGLQIPIPPSVHPRLYLTKKDIPLLKEKMNSHLLQGCWKKIENAAAFVTTGHLKLNGSKGNFDLSIRNAIEAKALLYLLNNDATIGREAIEALLNFYATLTTDMDKPDVCRDIGRAIVTGAIVYDWCYDLTTAEEKILLIGRMETLATQLEIEWPKLSQGSITGHGAEAQLARDMLSFGIATYQEKPIIYNLAAGRIIAEFVPARKFFYPGAYHHQGSAYGPYRFNWDMYCTFIFDKMGFPQIFGNDQSKAPYYFIYSRRPDGQLLRNGDEFTELFTPFGKYWSVGSSANLFAGSYYKDGILINEAIKEGQLGKGSDYLFDFLFFDPTISLNETQASLPLTRYFKEPFGAMIARTGWGQGLESSAVVAEMKVGVYNFVNHQHLDAGSFQLYYKGPMTVQSGIYQGKTGSYGGEHFKNYYQRSIAHNTMLVFDPSEKFLWHGKNIANDGGQVFPNNGQEAKTLSDFFQNDYKTGEVLAHAFGPDSIKPEFSYLKGELSAAYSSKVKSFKRSFVFLNFNDKTVPAALIVFDNITTSNKDFKKYWLLHSVQEPSIKGIYTTVVRNEKGYSGKMINTTLLPAVDNLHISKIGGSGNEYHVFGKNYPQSPNNDSNSMDSASWRIEVTAKKAVADDIFLNVMQVMDENLHTQKISLPVKFETDKLTGTKVGDRIVLFSKNGETITDKFMLNIKGNGIFKVLITDVQQGNWEIKSLSNKMHIQDMKNNEEVLYFIIKAGSYVISKK
ncbi:MAG: heparinase II/III family protein [Ferruginibacter sp.]|nr:heparinase II/III family protein [Ferruginibacter sp.]